MKRAQSDVFAGETGEEDDLGLVFTETGAPQKGTTKKGLLAREDDPFFDMVFPEHAETSSDLESGDEDGDDRDEDEDEAMGSEGGAVFDLGPRTESMAEDYALTQRALSKKAVLLQQQQQQSASSSSSSSSSSAGVAAQAPASNVILRMPQLSNMLFREAEKTEREHQLPSLLDGSDPSIVTFMRQILTCLPKETVPAHLNPQGVASARATLRVSRRQHEESLMRTPLPGERACSNASACMGTRIAGGSGAVLVAYTFEGDTAPVPDGLCILCMRKVVYGNVISLRAENRCMRPMQVLLCSFYNLVNVPGEYRPVDCIGPAEHVFEGLIMPVVKLDLCSFRRVSDPAMQVVRFQQLLPHVSETPKPVQEQLTAALRLAREEQGNF